MQLESTTLPEVKICTPGVFSDDRGFFLESFNQKYFKKYKFVQDNHSCSAKGVLRGLHYQLVKPQGKLVRVISGAILDVAVDIRRSSSNFGKWVAEELSAENFKQMWVPPGFAHGFIVLTDKAEVLYKTTEYWYKEHDRNIRWNDPDLNIDWQTTTYPILSMKDVSAPFLQDAEIFD